MLAKGAVDRKAILSGLQALPPGPSDVRRSLDNFIAGLFECVAGQWVRWAKCQPDPQGGLLGISALFHASSVICVL